MRSALDSAGGNPLSSVVPNETSSQEDLTLARIDELAKGLNSNRDNVLVINSVLLQLILEDAFFGTAYRSVIANINTDYKLTYGVEKLADSNEKELQTVKEEVDYFNRCVHLPQLIRDVMSRVYAEGNVPLRLRVDDVPAVDIYPLTIAYPSEYLYGGRTVLEFSVKELKSRLQNTYKKSKRTKKAIYFENMKAEVKANYPDEVYKGYEANEDVVRLDPRYSDCVKINDLGRRFGVSPLFCCLRPLIVLRQIEAADVSDSKARAKKILFQKLRKELLGNDGTRKGLDQAVYAHQQLTSALRTPSSVYTGSPAVESVEYVQIKNTSEESVNQQKLYTQKMLTGLGVGFSDIDSTVGAANISVKQLLRIINTIGENLETVLNKFYRTWVEDCGHDPMFAPTIKIIDAEQMEMNLRQELASFVYNTLNGSRKTAMGIIGMDYEDERAARVAENDNGDDDVFYARETTYTRSNDNTGGRPAGEETDRQDYDKNYSRDVRE